MRPDEIKACWCFDCLDAPEMGIDNPATRYMIVCPDCGNKRCPRATSHKYACTRSNEPGQPGSRYVAPTGSGAGARPGEETEK